MQTSKENIQLTVNGNKHSLQLDPETPLLYALRNQANIFGPKYGCGLGQCGSCMVLLEGQAIMSCTIPVKAAEGKTVTTLAGLLKEDGGLHAVQQAFIDEQAAQCGYCTSGMILSAVALLENNPAPTETEIRQALQHNLCRCGTQPRVIRAVRRAVQQG